MSCCVSNILDLTATGTNLNWYSDPGLTTNVGFGSPFATGQTTVGTYTYYVTQSLNGCESPATTVTFTVSNTTPAGTLAYTPVCAGVSTLLTLTSYAGNVLRYGIYLQQVVLDPGQILLMYMIHLLMVQSYQIFGSEH